MEEEGGEQDILLDGENILVHYGRVDDVIVNGESVVDDYIATINTKTINGQQIIGEGNINITVPTKTSDLTNDSGFITNAVNNLVNYYLKSETYTKLEVNELIAQIQTASFEVVEELPEVGQPNIIYLVPRSVEEENNGYDEYIYIDDTWEKIGSTDIDLTGYATEEWVNTQLGDYYTKEEIQGLLLKNIRDGKGDLSIEANQDSIAIGKWAFSEGRGQTFEVEITAVDSANNKITVTDTDGIIRKNALLWIFDSNADGAYYFVKSVSGTAPTITLTLDANQREIKDGNGGVIRTHYLSNVTTGTTITGYMGVAGASASHTEGVFNNTAWLNSETEKNEINVNRNHAEGSRNIATGYTAHAEGEYTEAIGNSSHAEGSNTVAQGHFSHAEGNATQAIGDNSHASGENTIAGYDNQTVVGRYNKNSSDTLFEVGNGTSGTRKNVFTVKKDGSLVINNDYPFEMTDITPERVLDSRIYGGLYRVGFRYNLGNGDSEYGEVLTIPYIGSAPNYNPYSAQIFFPNGDSSNNKNNFWYRTCQGKLNNQPNWNAWVKVTPKDYIKDVQINGTSIVSDGVANIPIASSSSLGLVKDFGANYGIQVVSSSGRMFLTTPTDAQITARNQQFAVTTNKLDYAVKAAMTDGVGAAWTDAEKAAARQRMGVPNMEIKSGTTNPTTSTSADYIGQLYYNSDKKYWFECTSITSDGATPPTYTYTWNRTYLESLTSGIVIGNPRTEQEGTINIGEGKSISSGTSGRWSTCIGYANSCRSNYGLALGGSIGANAEGAIQLGQGSNNTTNTLSVGFRNGNNYELLDANGKIPSDRLPKATGGGSYPAGTFGVVNSITGWTSGIKVDNGLISLFDTTDAQIRDRASQSAYNSAIRVQKLDYAVKAAMTDGTGPAWTTAEQEAAQQRIGLTQETYTEKITTDRFNVIDDPVSCSIKTKINAQRTVVRLFVGKENYYPFPYYDSSKTMNGVTWTVNADGTVTANGTATADSIFTLYYTATEPTPSWLHDGCKWYLKACDGGSATTYYAKHVASGVIQTNDPVNMFNTVSPRVDLYIASGYTAENVVFSPRVTCDPACEFSPLGKLYEATVTTSDTEYEWSNITIEKGDIVLPQLGDYLITDTVYKGSKVGGEQWRYKNLSAFGTSITDQGNSPNAHDPNGDPTGKYLPYLIENGQFAPLNHLPSQAGDIDRTKSTNFGIAGGGLNGQILYYIRYYLKDNVNKGKRGDNCDLVTIEGSVNDFYNACPLGQVGDTVPYTHNLLPDSTADGTFAGACYCCFTEAIQNAPRATVVFITDSTGKNVSGGQDFSWGRTNSAGLKQIDYINMAKAVAKYVGIPVIDAGQDSSINNANPQYLVDHIHHTYLGGKQYADAIWEQLKNIQNKTLFV